MNPALTNLAIMLAMTQIAKKIPFEDPQVLQGVRIAYIVSNVIIFGLYFYAKQQIAKKNNMKTLKYKQQPSLMQGETEGKLVTTTIKEYDNEQVQTAIKSALQGIAMMAFMHLYMKYTNPLMIQSIMPLKSAIENKIVQIHVFGKAEEPRPFQTQSMFGQDAGGQTDKRTIEKAETSGSGGAKED